MYERILIVFNYVQPIGNLSIHTYINNGHLDIKQTECENIYTKNTNFKYEKCVIKIYNNNNKNNLCISISKFLFMH